jgi:hypothetical protein
MYPDDTRDKNLLYRKQLTPLCENRPLSSEREEAAMTDQERIGGQTASGLVRFITSLIPAMTLPVRYLWGGLLAVATFTEVG